MAVKVTSSFPSNGFVIQRIRPAAERNLLAKMQRVRASAIARAPVDKQGGGGRLKRNIILRARDVAGRFSEQNPSNPLICSYEIAVQVPYAAWVVRGTAPHTIRARGPWSLHNSKTGQFFGPEVKHPGIRNGNDFLQQAMRDGGF